MKNKVIPIFGIHHHCEEGDIKHIKISSFTEKACTISEIEEGHRHDYYEIVWLKRGKGIHHIDMVDYPYAGSVLFLLSPGQMHQIRPVEKAEGYVIRFLPALFSDTRDMEDYLQGNFLFDNIQSEPVIGVTSAAHAVFEDIFGKLEAEYNAAEEDKERILLAYLKILLTHISRLKRGQATKAAPAGDAGLQLFHQYKLAVERDFRLHHGVQHYATLLHTQPRTLNTWCRKYMGKTAGQLIADRILLEAKREFHYNRSSIKEIAYQLGFEDPAYFTRFFKKQTGTAPKEYKLAQLPSTPAASAV